VSLASLNLARVLADGEQVVVGVRAPPGVAASAAGGTGVGTAAGGAATPGAMVNINTADQAALESLPGVGPVTARSILDYRTEKGGFTSVDELLEVSGIGDATLAKISPYCTL
jgi:competence protein ComEA